MRNHHMRFSHIGDIFNGLRWSSRRPFSKNGGQIAIMRRYIVDRVWNAEGWEAKLIDSHFLRKLRGLNDAQKRHNAAVYVEKSRTHRKWAGIAAAFLAFSLITSLIEWDTEQLHTSFWVMIIALAWFHYSGRVEHLFLNVIEEIDQRLVADTDAKARFVEQQAEVEHQLNVQIAQEAREVRQANADAKVDNLRYELQSLHNDLGRMIEKGEVRTAAQIRGQIARVESQLRSLGG